MLSASFLSLMVRSSTETSAVGTNTATPLIFPTMLGITRQTCNNFLYLQIFYAFSESTDCLTSSSSCGTSEGTRFSSKSHLTALECVDGPELGHFTELTPPPPPGFWPLIDLWVVLSFYRHCSSRSQAFDLDSFESCPPPHFKRV